MSVPDSTSDDATDLPGVGPDRAHKPRSTKQFLLGTTTRLAMGFGILGLIGLGVWLTRTSVATLTIESFLRSKGVPADIEIEKLQLGTAQIRNLTLGPTDKPTLIAQTTTLAWHVDSKTRMLIIDRLDIDGVTARLAINKEGKLDFGALAPMLAPSTGPKRAVINNVTLSNAKVFLDTPLGPTQATVSLRGGERAGWRGYGDVLPPARLQARDSQGGQNFVPIRLGFAAYPGKDATTLGFAALPVGQSLTYQNFTARGLRGQFSGGLVLNKDGGLYIATLPSRLQFERLDGYAMTATAADIAIAPTNWTQNGAWQTTGTGSLQASGRFSSFRLLPSQQGASRGTAGPSRFQVQITRQAGQKLNAQVSGDFSELTGPVTASRIQVSGTGATNLIDATQIATADWLGNANISFTRLQAAPAMLQHQTATLPKLVQEIVAGPTSGQGQFDFAWGQKGGRVALAGPLSLTGARNARLGWTKSNGQAPTLIIARTPEGSNTVSALGAGRIRASVEDLGEIDGYISGATYGPSGWALIGRDIDFAGAALANLGVNARARLRTLNLSQSARADVNGQSVGVVTLTGPNSQAQLAFDGRAQRGALVGVLQGPINGFGAAFGLDGYGLRNGNVNLAIDARQIGRDWQGQARGSARANGFEGAGTRLTGLDLSVDASGRLTQAGNVAGQARFFAKANRASPTAAVNASGIDVAGQVDMSGARQAPRLSIAVNASATNVSGTEFALTGATSRSNFVGTLTPTGIEGQGTTSTIINRLSMAGSQGEPATLISGATLSGPYALAMGTMARNRPFWDGRLKLAASGLPMAARADLVVSARDIRGEGTQLQNLRATLPISVTAIGATNWSAQGRAAGTLAAGTVAGTRVVDADFSTRFDLRSRAAGLIGTSVLDAQARSLSTADTTLTDVSLKAPLSLTTSRDGSLDLQAPSCLTFAARSGQFPGQASVGEVGGKICPDTKGQLAVLGGPRPRIVATTQLDPIRLQIGGPDGDQRIELGEINGTFGLKPDGGLALDFLATQFDFSLKLPDGTTAIVKANEAALAVAPSGGSVKLEGRIGRLSSIGLPVLISGGADANLTANSRGLSGSLGFDDIIIKDIEKSPRFGEFRLAGSGNISGNRITIAGDVQEPQSRVKLADVVIDHNIATGSGRLAVDASDIVMSPEPRAGKPALDIVTLVPPLRGVVSDMVGVVSASTDIVWERGQPIVSGARVTTQGLDFGTLLGPVTALTGEVVLDDLLLVRSGGVQTIKLGSLNTGGIPILDGTVKFELPGNATLRLEDASWPFADGRLSVRPATWAFRDGDQAFTIDVEDVDLAKLLRLTEVPNLEIDGKVSGVFPIEVRNGNVEIVGGRLRAREGGGVIRYTGPGASPPPPPPTGFGARLRQRFFGKPPPAGADLAFEALRALEYKILEITVDGRLSGELLMGVILQGANQQVLAGQPFKFNIKMNVPVGQILDTVDRFNRLGTSPEVLTELDRVLKEDASAPSPTPPSPPPPPPLPPAP